MIFRKYISKEEAKKIWPNDKIYHNIDEQLVNSVFTKTAAEVLTQLLQEQFGEENNNDKPLS